MNENEYLENEMLAGGFGARVGPRSFLNKPPPPAGGTVRKKDGGRKKGCWLATSLLQLIADKISREVRSVG